MKFKRALGFKAIANVVVWIMLAGGNLGAVEGVYDSVTAHTSGAEQSDDITMLAITYRGNGAD